MKPEIMLGLIYGISFWPDPPRRLRAYALPLALALLLGPSTAAARPAATIAPVPARTAARLQPLAPGAAHWLAQQLSSLGLPVSPAAPIRQARTAEDSRSTRALLEIARASGADRALLVDLGFEAGRTEVVLRVHESGSGRLRGSGRAAGPTAQLGASLRTALQRLLPVLDIDAGRAREIGTPQIARLDAYTRALGWLDAGQLARAWRELADDPAPAAATLREEILERASQQDTSKSERARLLAARGRAEDAWKAILREASAQLYSERPRPRILLAAAEIQRARGHTSDARAYLERAVEVAPDDSEAALALASVQAQTGERAAAMHASARVRELAPRSAEALELLADLSSDPQMQAAAALRAAEFASEHFDSEAASRHFERAVALDPTREAEARSLEAALQLDLGRPENAAPLYRQAIRSGGESAERRLGLARSLAALHDTQSAEAAYRDALALEPQHPQALRELGRLYSDTQREQQAQPLLERAVALEPTDPRARRDLAENLRRQGHPRAARAQLQAAVDGASGRADAQTLLALARVQRELHEDDQARTTLERATALQPTSPALRRELAATYDALGRGDDAARQRRLRELLDGDEAPARNAPSAASSPAPEDALRRQWEGLLLGFAPLAGQNRAVALLGLRQARDWRSQLMRWLWPRQLDRERVEAPLRAAIEARHENLHTSQLDPALQELGDRLFDFVSRRSLDAGAIADVNAALRSDALFVAVARPGDALWPGPCGDPSQLHVALRRLAGSDPLHVQILANEICLSSAGEDLSSWNPRAAGIWGLLLMLLARPYLRGFGRLVVRVKLPDQTRALFSVSLTRRPRKVRKARTASELEEDAQGHFNQRLRRLGRFEKRLDPGKDLVFRWVPARTQPYYVTVHGPLFHSISEQLVGEFLEERTARVTRGRTSCLEFDLSPSECAVEVSVYRGECALQAAQIAVRGRPETLRYTRNGSAFLYLPKGRHTVLAGAGDRAAERELEIDSFDPLPLVIDLGAEAGLVFRDCPDAVAPFLEDNFDAAALALEARGETRLANRMRARAHEQRGEIREAAQVLEASGELEQAAELLSQQADAAGSAELYEAAGDFARAAEIHRAGGDMLAAARAYEAAYDFPNAIECHRELGANDRVLELLEKSAEYLEAGRLCIELGEDSRAVQNLQQVEARHPFYSEACRMLGELLCEQGHDDFALEKLDEARALSQLDSFPIEVQDRYARLLEAAGRLDEAIAVLQAIRRRDIQYADADDRLDALKSRVEKRLQQQPTLPHTQPGSPAEAASPAEAESRYEILEEIGRGGMGVVYRARDRQLDRVVALKKLPDNLRGHPAAISFFEREARSAARLNHPNIVTVYDAGQENGHYFISMELLEGTPLDAIVRKHGALPTRVVARLGLQIATGLHFAHRNKIIHRDIKTANLFLTRDKTVKIMDFGLAKMVEEVRRGATVIGGTPYYMAPEQAGGGSVDHRADLYAFGVTLFELATGVVPFREGDVGYQHRHTPAPDARELHAEVPAVLAELIRALMQKRPEDRPQQAAAAAATLQSLAEAPVRA